MTTKKKIDANEPIKDEIPGLLDFYATSAMTGFIEAAGIPNEESRQDYCDLIAELSYQMARTMYAEKYADQPKH